MAQVGRVPLLLLDSDVEENDDAVRDVTDRLYGGGSEHRLRQELLLGIGGVRALRAYCRGSPAHPAPEVFHTNEGHAGFLGLERIRELDRGRTASTSTRRSRSSRAGTVFTTHTPVPAGIDRFPRDLIEQYFGGDNAVARRPGRADPRARRRGLRRRRPGVFNMAVMGFRLAQRANGVSQLHGDVSREMFDGLWPGFDDGRGADHLDHQRRARPDLGRPRGLRAGRASTSAPTDVDDATTAWERRRRRSPTTRSGRPSASCASGWSTTPAAGCATSWLQARRQPRPSSAGSTTCSTPTC